MPPFGKSNGKYTESIVKGYLFSRSRVRNIWVWLSVGGIGKRTIVYTKGMIRIFPTPYPDEILYSVFARFADMMCFTDLKDVHRQLFGTASARAVVDLPTRMDAVVARLPGQRFTCEQLILQHTLYPYYAPFMPKERAERLKDLMCGNGGQGTHTLAGIIASVVQRPSRLRYCPACVLEDREVYGEEYWHRVHQLPGVEVCPKHGVFLVASSVPTSAQRTPHAYRPLSGETTSTVATPVNRKSRNDQLLLQIATDSQLLLNRYLISPGIEVLHERIKEFLALKGWLSQGGRYVRAAELYSEFSALYTRSLLQRLNIRIDEEGRDHWLYRLIRNPRRSQHPLQYILLCRFLGVSVEDLFSEHDRRRDLNEKLGKGPWPCLNKASDHYGRLTIERPESQTAGEDPVGIFQCPKCGFTYRVRASAPK